MKIEIDIKSPPDGYSNVERAPVYFPMDGILILIGECWVKASDRLKHGGEVHICCYKRSSND